jgi:hypothetical protein
MATHPVDIEQYTYDETAQARRTIDVGGLVTDSYDYVGLDYTGTNLTTVVFKTGGGGGTVVATLTLAYTGSRLDSITRS